MSKSAQRRLIANRAFLAVAKARRSCPKSQFLGGMDDKSQILVALSTRHTTAPLSWNLVKVAMHT